MARRSAVVVVAVQVLAVGTGAAMGLSAEAGPTAPVLRSASARAGHVRVSYSLPAGAVGSRIEVAVRRQVGQNGAFLRGVRLREQLPSRSGGANGWRTRGSLAPGRYFVHVSSI